MKTILEGHERVGDGIYDVSNVAYVLIKSEMVLKVDVEKELTRWEEMYKENIKKDEEWARRTRKTVRDNRREIELFVEKYPTFVVASAYETHFSILLSKMPPEASVEQIGSGFNYGSTNIINNCPRSLLILAEND